MSGTVFRCMASIFAANRTQWPLVTSADRSSLVDRRGAISRSSSSLSSSLRRLSSRSGGDAGA